ncbi:STAS domain-containing protein [Trichlorobacter lovleyi]|uniref:Sulfate transporter/antisigma-factor antagonist STAS n=1 Tax=Trichlorobacter lovleyi (strain ATCC BAA-1151 / DSM 17278 / SZ) TaxID=398767 RepID=B3EAL8_TRIL1|nr:STAS domain-containing protein [Trichlorobacter lovleyi]ACD95456.1 sulfate transporter/antisigma-factor antagonist STAS [Trichlorobacter lovleyi SZ]MDD2499785.1 STAS domain-containing protein [Geobacter sp.]
MSDLTLTHSTSSDGSALKISVAGRLAIDTAAELHGLLLEEIPSTNILLDVSGIEEIDLAGMQLICSACRTALRVQKRFNFSGCISPDVKKTIECVGLQRQSTCKHNADLPCIWCGGIN